MNCTKVLHALGGHSQQAVTPVDLAMRLCLGQAPPLYQLLGMQPRTSLPHGSSLELRSCFRRAHSHLIRKRVVFADAKGLALTAVRLFVPEPPSSPATEAIDSLNSSTAFKHSNHFNPSEGKLQGPSAYCSLARLHNLRAIPSLDRLQTLKAIPSVDRLQTLKASPSLARLQNLTLSPSLDRLQSLKTSPSLAKVPVLNPSSSAVQHFKLRLGFPQPTADAFASPVRLESCSVAERSLSGTVRVRGAGGPETKATVHLRVTLDSWRSHLDVPCALLPQRYGASDTDVFVFAVALPLQSLDPKERLEFCVLFRPAPGAALCWDDNRGHNYRVLVEPDGSNTTNHGSIARRSSTQNLQRPWNPQSSSSPLSSSPTSLLLSSSSSSSSLSSSPPSLSGMNPRAVAR